MISVNIEVFSPFCKDRVKKQWTDRPWPRILIDLSKQRPLLNFLPEPSTPSKYFQNSKFSKQRSLLNFFSCIERTKQAFSNIFKILIFQAFSKPRPLLNFLPAPSKYFGHLQLQQINNIPLPPSWPYRHHQKYNYHLNNPQAIARLMMMKCRCHGVSGSCEFKTCWKSLPKVKSKEN